MAWDRNLPPAAQLPAGLAGMVAHENRLLSQPEELLSAEGVAMDDLSIRKEPGLAAYDTAGLTTGVAFSGTFSDADTFSTGHLMSFPADATVAYVKSLTSGTVDIVSPATTGSIVLTVPAGGVPIGDLVVVAVSFNEDDFAAGQVSIADTGANTYTEEFGDTGTQSTLVVYHARLTVALAAGNTITVSFTGLSTADQTVRAVAVGDQFTGVTSNTIIAEASTTTGTNSITVGPLPSTAQSPILAVASAGSSEPSSVMTAGSGFTKRTEAFNNGAVLDVDDRGVRIASRVVSEEPDIIALVDWYSDAITTPAGTVTTTAGSTTVTGSGTTFTAHAPGDRIVVANETRIIETITSATVLDTTAEWVVSNTGATYQIRVGNRIVTATSGGNIFKEKPTSLTTGDIDAVTLASGLNLSARPGRFVVAGKEAAALDRRLFYFNGVDVPRVLAGDATTMTTINTATNPVDWADTANQGQQPINGTLHQNRLAAWGNLNDPHRVYFSDPDDHDDWVSAESFDMRFRSEIGDRIFCGISHQGILFVWKYPRGIFYLDDSELLPESWVVRTKSESLGCAPSTYAACSVDDDVLFMDPNGHFHLLSAVDAFGGVRNSDVTLRLGLAKWTRENLNLKLLSHTVSYWYPQKKLAVFYVPGDGDTENTLALKFDFSGAERGLPVKFSFSRRDAANGVAVRRASDGGPETPIIGEGAFVYLADQEARNKNGVAYTGQYQLPHLDFEHIDPQLRWHTKQYEALELVLEPVVAGTLAAEVFVDGALKQTLEFDATRRYHYHTLRCGDGRTLSVRFTNSAVNEDFKVLAHHVYFKVGNQAYRS